MKVFLKKINGHVDEIFNPAIHFDNFIFRIPEREDEKKEKEPSDLYWHVRCLMKKLTDEVTARKVLSMKVLRRKVLN